MKRTHINGQGLELSITQKIINFQSHKKL